jgi:hypothetical protein
VALCLVQMLQFVMVIPAGSALETLNTLRGFGDGVAVLARAEFGLAAYVFSRYPAPMFWHVSLPTQIVFSRLLACAARLMLIA